MPNPNHDDHGRFAAGEGQGTHSEAHQALHEKTVANPLVRAALERRLADAHDHADRMGRLAAHHKEKAAASGSYHDKSVAKDYANRAASAQQHIDRAHDAISRAGGEATVTRVRYR